MNLALTGERPLTILKPSNGHYYHRKDQFSYTDGISTFIPVNRNYVECQNGERCSFEGKNYDKNPIIFDCVKRDTPLYPHELRVNIHGMLGLFLDDPDYRRFDPTEWDDSITSLAASRILEGLRVPDCEIGVFGSHRLGLIGKKSDIDLIGYTDNRQEVLPQLVEQLEWLGIREIRGDGKELQHARKYADRHNVNFEAGLYLAQQRQRFVTSEGLPVSLQLMPHTYDTSRWDLLLNSHQAEGETRNVKQRVNVIKSNSFGLPKTWEVETEEGQLPILGLRWSQQGMGEEQDCEFNGTRVDTFKGSFLYLRETDSYLLPNRVL